MTGKEIVQAFGRGDDTVGKFHRAQISQFDLFEFIIGILFMFSRSLFLALESLLGNLGMHRLKKSRSL